MFFRGMATETYLPEDSSSGPNIEISTNLFLPRSGELLSQFFVAPLTICSYSDCHDHVFIP